MMWTSDTESSKRPVARCLTIAVIAVLSLSFAAATAMADEAPDNEEEGLLKLRTANDAFDDEDFDTAYENYVQAYEILEIPMIKYRMGQTAEKTDRVQEAIDHYESYREIGEDEEFLARIDESLPELRGRVVASLEIVTEPAGAEVVVVDLEEETQEEIGETPAIIEREAGSFEIELKLQDHETQRIKQQLEAGDQELVEARLKPVETDEEPEADEESRPVAMEAQVEAVEDEESMSVWGWTSTGLGASILALGGVMSFFQAQTTREINEFDRTAETEGSSNPQQWTELRQEQEARKNDAQSYNRAATGAFIAGGVLTAAGLSVLGYDAFFGGDDGGEPGVGLRTGLSSEGGYIGIDGRF